MGQRKTHGVGCDSSCYICGVPHCSTAAKPGAAANKTAQNKIDKYAKLAFTDIFYPFAVETAGTWHHMAIELTQEIGRRITAITEDTIAFQRRNVVSFHNTMVTE